MNEVLLLPRQAQSLHPTIPEMVTALSNALHQAVSAISERMQIIATAIGKKMQSIANTLTDWWKRYMTPRVPRKSRHSPQTRAFLRTITARQRHIEVKARQRKRSARRAMSYVEAAQ